jgi:hypothetical protein
LGCLAAVDHQGLALLKAALCSDTVLSGEEEVKVMEMLMHVHCPSEDV